MLKFLVERESDTVEVLLLKNKSDQTYSFVNITKGHICECKFDSIDEAIKDMDSYVLNGKIINYKIIE